MKTDLKQPVSKHIQFAYSFDQRLHPLPDIAELLNFHVRKQLGFIP
jgi:hypothetical protein